MSPSLFHQIVFGPIVSRRLGISLGVNLLPLYGKWCSFDCIYCECGWNANGRQDQKLPDAPEVEAALRQKLSELSAQQSPPDVITFSGNGEPTMHPHFKEIIEITLRLRNQYAPKAQVCVLSNASQLHRPQVREGLLLADKRIMKIDSAIPETLQKIDQPAEGYDLQQTITQLKDFQGDFTLQTLFLKGFHNGVMIDNATPEELNAWLHLVQELRPKEVMVYTIDRETPAKELVKISRQELEAIAVQVRNMGIEVIVAG